MQENVPFLTREYDMLPPGASVLCAVSGGADSVCLLHWLSQQGDLTLTAAHFNHQLRGAEADRDEAFVRDLCEAWHIPLTVGRGDVRAFAKREGLSIEEGARILRYAFLEETAEAEGCQFIATAHTADDNAETVLLNLIRGTGLKGLGGIPPVQGNIVRPLLHATKKQVVQYLTEHQIPHVEDASNTDKTYTRNRLRSQVMPVLKELNPKAVEHINAAATQAREVDEYLEAQARRAFVGLGTGPGWVCFPWNSLQEAPAPLRPRLLLLLLDQMNVPRKDFGAAHLKAMLRLENERSIDLPQGVTARRERGRLFLSRRQALPARVPLTPGKPLDWGNYTLTLLELQGSGPGPREALPEDSSGLQDALQTGGPDPWETLQGGDLGPVGDPPGGEPGAVETSSSGGLDPMGGPFSGSLALSLPAGAVLTVGPCPPGERLTLPGAKGGRTVKRLCLDKGISLAERDGLPAFYADGALAAVWPLGVDAPFAPQTARDWYIQIKYTEKDEET